MYINVVRVDSWCKHVCGVMQDLKTLILFTQGNYGSYGSALINTYLLYCWYDASHVLLVIAVCISMHHVDIHVS